MNSSEARISRIPEIENIALREAFEALGVEAPAQGDDILVRVGRGPEGPFVREALGVTPAVNKEDTMIREIRLAGASGADKPVTRDRVEKTMQALESLTISEAKLRRAARLKAPACPSEVSTDEVLELLCRNAPQQAFELALDAFARVAEPTRAMVEEQAIDLALIEAQRMEIDRKQAETRILLRELVGQEW